MPRALVHELLCVCGAKAVLCPNDNSTIVSEAQLTAFFAALYDTVGRDARAALRDALRDAEASVPAVTGLFVVLSLARDGRAIVVEG